jgi:hypothetical protein
MTRDMGGIAQVVKAFYVNDPFYARSYGETSVEVRLWKFFRTRYLGTSKGYVDREVSGCASGRAAGMH